MCARCRTRSRYVTTKISPREHNIVALSREEDVMGTDLVIVSEIDTTHTHIVEDLLQ